MNDNDEEYRQRGSFVLNFETKFYHQKGSCELSLTPFKCYHM